VKSDVAARTEYATVRRYDLAGNKVTELDPDGHTTRWTYGHENRVLETVDAIGRFDRKTYDSLGQLVLEEIGAGTTVRLTRTSQGYDGLGWPLGMTEDPARGAGAVGTVGDGGPGLFLSRESRLAGMDLA
jgi:YD repeat-containing protein